MEYNVQTCQFISATDLVPKSWGGFFWEQISEDAPFSWGDTNRSLVTAADFSNHCAERLDDSPDVKQWLEGVRALGQMYIDLES